MATINEEIYADNPRRYYRMNEAANAVINQGVDGSANLTLSGTPGFQTIDETDRNAIKFSGDDFGNVSSYTFTVDMTIEAWVRYTTATSGNDEMIVNADQTTNQRWFRLYKAANGRIACYVFPNGGTTGLANFDTGIDHRDGLWHHVVLRIDNISGVLSNLTLWTDGILRASSTMPGPMVTTPASPLYISQETGFSGGVKYVGYLKHVAVYNYALSDARIAAHAAATDIPVFLGTFTKNDPDVMYSMPRKFRSPKSPKSGELSPTTGQIWPRKG